MNLDVHGMSVGLYETTDANPYAVAIVAGTLFITAYGANDLDYVIGGVDQAGKGWKMLMSALAAGRGISLPSLSAAGAAFTAHVSGAYARIREQFHVAIARFEAIQ